MTDKGAIRLALIAGTYQPNQCGVAHYTGCLRAGLLHEAVYSTVLTTRVAAQQLNEPDVWGIVNDWQVADLWPLIRAIHKTPVDILHIQHAAGTYGFARAIFLLPLLLRLTGWQAPIVTTIHEYGWWEWQPRWFPLPLLEWLKTWGQQHYWWDREDGFLMTYSDAIITTNHTATDTILARLPNLKSRLYQIPIGANISVATVDRQHARSAIRQHYGWPGDAPVIAFFGFLHPVKGLETLLTAFKQVQTIHPHARLLLIGGVESLALREAEATAYWQKLEQAIAELDLTRTVGMTGYLDDQMASQHLTAADIGVLPFNHGVTLKSGSLLALMAHSLPVIATRSTPPEPELNDSLVRLITPRSSDQLAQEIIHLLETPTLREQLATAGQHFSQSYTWSGITEAHSKIYQMVLSRPAFTKSEVIA